MSFETPVRVKRVAHVGAFIGDPYVAVEVVAAQLAAAQPAASSSPGAGAVRSVRRRLEAEEAEEQEDVDSLCVVGGGLCGAVSQLRVRECDRREHARRVKSSLSECERVSLSSCIERGALNPGACVHPVLFRRAQAPATLTLLYQLVGGFAVLIVAAGLLGQWRFNPTPVAWLSLLFQAVVVSFFSYLTWFWLLKRYLASRLGVFSFLTPLFGMLFGVWLLAEPLEASFVAGTVLVLAGVAVVSGYGWWRQRRVGAAG